MASAPFKVGQRELFLPNVTIVLLRNQSLGPNYATFQVPLWFNKLDLRDYLYNAYNVRSISIRSYIKLQRITQGTPTPSTISSNLNQPISTIAKPQYRRWHRPKSIKRMTVELERPFQWPKAPDSFEDWNQESTKLAKEQGERAQERLSPNADLLKPADDTRKTLREQAQRLLSGKERWRPGMQQRLGLGATR